jgi:hypothetical protein
MKRDGNPEKGKLDKKAAKQFDANVLMLKGAFLKDDPANVTLPVHSEADSVAEFVELIDQATKVTELKNLLSANGMKTSFKNKTEMIKALLMHNVADTVSEGV